MKQIIITLCIILLTSCSSTKTIKKEPIVKEQNTNDHILEILNSKNVYYNNLQSITKQQINKLNIISKIILEANQSKKDVEEAYLAISNSQKELEKLVKENNKILEFVKAKKDLYNLWSLKYENLEIEDIQQDCNNQILSIELNDTFLYNYYLYLGETFEIYYQEHINLVINNYFNLIQLVQLDQNDKEIENNYKLLYNDIASFNYKDYNESSMQLRNVYDIRINKMKSLIENCNNKNNKL